MIAIELNDAGILLAREGQILCESPGYALLEKDGLVLGREALRAAHLKPAQTVNQFWLRLGSSARPLPRLSRLSYADLALAQLAQLSAHCQDDKVIFVVPGNFSKQQVGMLLGLSRKQGLMVAGLVDAALVAVTDIYPHEQLVHLDISLHQLVLTGLEHHDERVPTHYQILERGLVALQRAWVERIARCFVRATRFDPLHRAATEQALYDQLPDCLERLRTAPITRLRLRAGTAVHEVVLQRDELWQVARGFYEEIGACLAAVRHPGVPLVVNLSQRLSLLPGLIESLRQQLSGCSIVPLGAGAAALGALRHAAAIETDPAQPTFTASLPFEWPYPVADQANSPSHLVFRGLAYPIGERPLRALPGVEPGTLTFSNQGGREEQAYFQVSRQEHRVLLELRHGEIWRNGSLVEAFTRLKVGDRIRQSGVCDEVLAIALTDAGNDAVAV